MRASWKHLVGDQDSFLWEIDGIYVDHEKNQLQIINLHQKHD